MFPFGASRTAQEIGGPWLGDDFHPLPTVSFFSPKAKVARGEERDADHLVEDGFVAMPANAGAGRVFGDQRMLKAGGSKARQGRGPLAQREQQWWNVIDLLELALVEVVAPPERHDSPLAEKSIELEALKRQRLHLPDQVPFFVRRDEFRLISEPLRKRLLIGEETGLIRLIHAAIS